MQGCTIILLIILFLMLWYIFFRDGKEGYWTLPFAGGDVRTFGPEQHKISSVMRNEMSAYDMDLGPDGSDYPL